MNQRQTKWLDDVRDWARLDVHCAKAESGDTGLKRVEKDGEVCN